MRDQDLLQRKARALFKYAEAHLRCDDKSLRRPFFIEISGTPSAGKTRSVFELDKLLRHHDLRVLRLQEGTDELRHLPRTTPLFNIQVGIHALHLLLETSVGHDFDVVIFERGIFDAYCWMLYWLDKKQITPEECKLVQSFLVSPLWSGKIDAAYFLVCDSEEAVRRKFRTALSHKLGETTTLETHRNLVSQYRRAYAQLRGKHPQLVLMDTTRLDEKEMVKKIADHALSALEKKIDEDSK